MIGGAGGHLGLHGMKIFNFHCLVSELVKLSDFCPIFAALYFWFMEELIQQTGARHVDADSHCSEELCKWCKLQTTHFSKAECNRSTWAAVCIIMQFAELYENCTAHHYAPHYATLPDALLLTRQKVVMHHL